MNINPNSDMCLVSKENDPWLWHKRFCYLHFKAINNVTTQEFSTYYFNVIKDFKL